MTTSLRRPFFDFDLTVNRHGQEVHLLRADCKSLPIGFCRVTKIPAGEFTRECYVRTTQWHSKNGKRVETYYSLQEALDASIAWAWRRMLEDDRVRRATEAARASYAARTAAIAARSFA